MDAEGWRFPEGLTVHLDLGFKGLNAEGVTIGLLHKKPRTRELNGEQKKAKQAKGFPSHEGGTRHWKNENLTGAHRPHPHVQAGHQGFGSGTGLRPQQL